MYCPLYVLVVWYCKIRRVGGGGAGTCDVPEMRKNFEEKCCPANLYGNLCCVNICPPLNLHEYGQYDSVV